MKLTIFILLLPVIMFFGFLVVVTHDYYTLASLLLFSWILTFVICFIRGFFIFLRQRKLAWCCFAMALLQLIIAILMPAFVSKEIVR